MHALLHYWFWPNPGNFNAARGIVSYSKNGQPPFDLPAMLLGSQCKQPLVARLSQFAGSSHEFTPPLDIQIAAVAGGIWVRNATI